MDDADDGGATIALPPTTTVRSTRRWWRAHRVDPSLRALPPTESAFGRSRDRAANFGGGRVPKILCCAARPANPHAGTIPAGAAARGQPHARHTMLRCAEPPPVSSQRRLGAPAARQLGAPPPRFSAARPHCGRAPTHATVPLGGPPPLITPFSRGGADPESRVAADVHQQKPCPARPPPLRARQ